MTLKALKVGEIGGEGSRRREPHRHPHERSWGDPSECALAHVGGDVVDEGEHQ